ncbi:MAG: SDR family oxidoreductase [Planctomycetota bacterium]|nr:SDR family oxidoreductase [Planctomycetota bacterium]
MLRLDQKAAIITGGGSGIGRGIAELFAKQGCHVMILDSDTESAQQTVNTIENQGGNASFFFCDVTDHQKTKAVTQQCQTLAKRIDLLVNNAGVAHVGNALNTPEADFDRVMDVNAKGVYNMTQAVLPHMIATGKGAILNIASTVAWFGIADRFAYTASKGAVTAMTYSIAKDFVKQNIRCNAILPGRIHTPFVDGFVKKNFPGKEEEMMEKLADYQPIGRMGQPHEIATAALFLCSDEASFVTGSIHAIDGGTISLR